MVANAVSGLSERDLQQNVARAGDNVLLATLIDICRRGYSVRQLCSVASEGLPSPILNTHPPMLPRLHSPLQPTMSTNYYVSRPHFRSAPFSGKSTDLVHYKLHGVLYHHGNSAGSGHYTVDVLHPNGDSASEEAWLCVDDEDVRAVRQEDVFRNSGNAQVDDR